MILQVGVTIKKYFIWIRMACVTQNFIQLGRKWATRIILVVAWPMTTIHLLSFHSLLVKPCNGLVLSNPSETWHPPYQGGHDWKDFRCMAVKWKIFGTENIHPQKRLEKIRENSTWFPQLLILVMSTHWEKNTFSEKEKLDQLRKKW